MYRILIAFVVFIGGCADPQVAGGPIKLIETSVPLRQMDNVTRDVQQWHDMQYPNCKFDSMVRIKIAKQDANTAHEEWTVKACGKKTFTYAVFVVRHSGGISDSVGNVGGRPMQVDSSEGK